MKLSDIIQISELMSFSTLVFCAGHEIYEIYANVIPLEKFQNAITGVCIKIQTATNKFAVPIIYKDSNRRVQKCCQCQK